MKKIYFDELSKQDQDVLTMIYGDQSVSKFIYNSQKFSYIAELEDNEKIFFDKKTFGSPNFFIQKLYKIKGNLIPLKFNLAVNKLVENTEELRMNYCTLNDRTVKVFFEERREMPPIVYRNLENDSSIDITLKNIMNANMRQNFDLRHDFLIRFSVFHTAEEEYAVLVTMPQSIEPVINLNNFFRSVFNLEPVQTESEKFQFRVTAMPETIKNYWVNILKDLSNMPELPFAKFSNGVLRQKSHHMKIPKVIMSDLREKAKSNTMMVVAIFLSAWAILLQEFNKSKDTAFLTLIPDKSATHVNTIPVRIRTTEEITPQDIVNSQFKQILVSQPYAFNNFAEIQKIIQPQNKTFDHFLSFGDCLREEKLFSSVTALPEGQFVMQNSWNAQATKLGIYFHYIEDTTTISILYNGNKFADNFGERLAKRYYDVLQQMLTDWNLTYDKFIKRLSEKLQIEPAEQEYDVKYVQNFISQLNILQGINAGNLQNIIKVVKINTYFEGDRISEHDIEENIIFVVEGKLVRSIETGDGWYNTLDIVQDKRWINEHVLLPDHKTKISAEVLTEKAILMMISLDNFKDILKNNPDIEHNFLLHILKEMEKYQRLWIQS